MQKEPSFTDHVLQEQLQSYMSNTLTAAARAEVEDHLYGCKHCMDLYLAGIEEILLAPDESEAYKPPADFNQKVMQTVHAYMAQQRPKNKMTAKGKISGAFKNKIVICYLIAASISLFLIWSGSLQDMQKATAALGAAQALQTEQAVQTGQPEEHWIKNMSWLSNLWNQNTGGK